MSDKATLQAAAEAYATGMLEPGEQLLEGAHAHRGTVGIGKVWNPIALVFGLLALLVQGLIIRHYYVVLTNRRVLIVQLSRFGRQPKSLKGAFRRENVRVSRMPEAIGKWKGRVRYGLESGTFKALWYTDAPWADEIENLLSALVADQASREITASAGAATAPQADAATVPLAAPKRKAPRKRTAKPTTTKRKKAATARS